MRETQRLEDQVQPLVRRARGGDQTAMDQLLRQCHHQIYRWALTHTGDLDDADDVTQETLVRLHTKLAQYRAESRFTTWLYQVTRSAALEIHRGRRRRALGRARLRLHGGGGADDPREDRLERLHASDVAQLVRTLFEDLPERQREVFDLVDLQGHSPREVSAMLGLEPPTVRVHLLRARRAIRERILARHPHMAEQGAT